jgi:hypothetical protein
LSNVVSIFFVMRSVFLVSIAFLVWLRFIVGRSSPARPVCVLYAPLTD